MPEPSHDALSRWKLAIAERTNALGQQRLLHCGAKPWAGSPAFDHTDHWPGGQWFTTDLSPGEGVDIVGDLHTLWQTTTETFDGIYCQSVFEHLQRPWLAMHSLAQLLRPQGVVFIGTHQAFPLHYYPDDYFRFSTAALEGMARDSGLEVLHSNYDGPCTINPVDRERLWNPLARCYLDVSICARKP